MRALRPATTLWLRTPLIPGATATRENISAPGLAADERAEAVRRGGAVGALSYPVPPTMYNAWDARGLRTGRFATAPSWPDGEWGRAAVSTRPGFLSPEPAEWKIE
jgi:hypothetical protein